VETANSLHRWKKPIQHIIFPNKQLAVYQLANIQFFDHTISCVNLSAAQQRSYSFPFGRARLFPLGVYRFTFYFLIILSGFFPDKGHFITQCFKHYTQPPNS
jgi:hypothetical protein